ncbi:hypothetical protein HP15_2866 [Marinobacter adhaerens HP15]|uniref:Uncharacterized protein n=2 Tax=Marinobacter adhaerens TaxID=1033846 RepID=E4PMB8_MARAH|nr:hypothetical protein HP15_2866 [Marinobacter adhaerens HP15]
MKKMPNIEGKKISAKDIPQYTWNADLVDFDGPLLSLFKSEDGEDALFSWLDCSNSRNRWCILPLSRELLGSYLKQETSLLEVFQSLDSFVVFDVTPSHRRTNFTLTNLSDLPQDYIPDPESYLFDEISTDAATALRDEETEEYYLGLDGGMYIDDLSLIPKTYQQLYSFHYGLEHLQRDAVSHSFSRILKGWTGGFSSVNVFTGLRSVIPSIHRVRISELRYNSPGHIKVNLLPKLAEKIESAANYIENEENFRESEQFYKDVYNFFKDHKIAGFEEERNQHERSLTPDTNKEIMAYVDTFFEMMDWTEYQENFKKVHASPLLQLRILLAYYRRLKKLRPYIVRGHLSIGSSLLT